MFMFEEMREWFNSFKSCKSRGEDFIRKYVSERSDVHKENKNEDTMRITTSPNPYFKIRRTCVLDMPDFRPGGSPLFTGSQITYFQPAEEGTRHNWYKMQYNCRYPRYDGKIDAFIGPCEYEVELIHPKSE